jgi:triosephosphate isomerase (TIM)
MRRVIIAGNWKMHMTVAEARSFVRDMKAALGAEPPKCEVLVAPPFTAVAAVAEAASGSSVQVGGQDMHWENKGAFTGEVSAGMLKEAGCSHVIIGHSERRQFFGETDETVNKKVAAALGMGLVPVFCLGELLDERKSGATFDVVKRQLTIGLGDIRPDDPERFVLAYEPVWAIGTGLTASPEQAQEVHRFLRQELASILGVEFADKVRILYGGSVKPDNTNGLVNRPDIDGALVGGASLKVADFVGIIKAAT